MRQLPATGWMHNRCRMIVASFLTKDLLIDWRWGERHFMRKLIDGDLAANNGGWQWAASTGTDTQPWFRIFNPTSQGERFDPDGKQIEMRHGRDGDTVQAHHLEDALVRPLLEATRNAETAAVETKPTSRSVASVRSHSSRRAVNSRLTRSAASARANASPIPAEAPVTTAQPPYDPSIPIVHLR